MHDQLNQDDFPLGFKCPLTLEVMIDPVVDSEGNSYERQAITNWLLKNPTSPVTRNPIKITDLKPNRALSDLIHEFYKTHNLPIPSKPEVQHQNVQVDSQISLQMSEPLKDGQDTAVMFTIQPPSGTAPTPTDICCVIDVSGSMGTEAKLQNAEGKSEAHGLSILDIVIHAVRTIIHILSDQDRLALVVYSTSARTILPLTPMTATGKSTALAAIAHLRPEDQTNLWDGLVTGLDILKQGSTRLSHIMLLTDGQPNVIPPRGHIPMLQRYKDNNGGLPCSIHTFGFGYSLDSALLRDLASFGNGSYAFIPDSGMVGTAFVHATSNILVTMAKNASLSIEGKCEVLGGFPVQYTSWGALVAIGNIQYDQSRNIVVKVTGNSAEISAKLEYTSADNKQCQVTVESSTPSSDTLVHFHRLLALDWIKDATSLDSLPSLLDRLRSSSSDSRTAALIKDLEGQVTEALSRKDWYTRWGVHYLPSLVCSHRLQQCNNFKDPGVQVYGGRLFTELRDKADDIFVGLPPPKPSAKPSAAPVTSMRTYHSSGNTCFHGDCLVTMADMSVKLVKDVRKGDCVLGGTVTCVVKTVTKNADLCYLPNGLVVTPYHPISIKGKWTFPIEIAPVKNVLCTAVYSFVLENGHSMIINGTECASMGHGIRGNNVVEHDYFGSEKVIEDLKKMKGWNEGEVILIGDQCLVRSEETGLVCGLRQIVECC